MKGLFISFTFTKPCLKGDVIDPNIPLVKSFDYRLGPDDTTRCWNADIVVSQNEPSFLPKSLKHGMYASSPTPTSEKKANRAIGQQPA